MSFQCIRSVDALHKLQAGAQLVDIRDAVSFAAAHVPGALNLNNQNLADFIARADFEKPLLVMCYHGHSSQGAAQFLSQQGFDEVYSVDGGFEIWKLSHPVEQA